MVRNKSKLSKKILWPAAILVAVLVILLILEAANVTHFLHKDKVPAVIPTHSNSSSAARGSVNNQSDNSPATSTGSNIPAPIPAPSNHALIVPSGNFVSNHFPGQNNSPTTEASTCNTTPGATCFIKFTNSSTGESTQLPTQTVDARGSTSWYWDINKDAHLTSGEWRITAVAVLNGQTRTADDALQLTIQ